MRSNSKNIVTIQLKHSVKQSICILYKFCKFSFGVKYTNKYNYIIHTCDRSSD